MKPDPTPLVFISSTTFQRKRIFQNTQSAELFRSLLYSRVSQKQIHLHAYAIMPDHYHAVVTIMRGSAQAFAQQLHSYFVHRLSQINGRERRRIWQHNVWYVWIDTEQKYYQKVAYTLLNPWRANLVSDPFMDYPLSNIREWKDRHGIAYLHDLFGTYGRRWE